MGAAAYRRTRSSAWAWRPSKSERARFETSSKLMRSATRWLLASLALAVAGTSPAEDGVFASILRDATLRHGPRPTKQLFDDTDSHLAQVGRTFFHSRRNARGVVRRTSRGERRETRGRASPCNGPRGRAHVRSAPSEATGIKRTRRLRSSTGKEARKALRSSGESQKTPSSASQDFLLCGEICGTSLLDIVFIYIFMDAADGGRHGGSPGRPATTSHVGRG